MIPAEALLKILAKKDLLPSAALQKLEKQIASATKPVPAKSLAKRLVQKGYLTPSLAKRLLRSLESMAQETATDLEVVEPMTLAGDEDDLGLVPTDHAEEKKKAEAAKEDWERELELEEVVPDKKSAKPTPKPSTEPVPTAALDDVVTADVVTADVVTAEVVSGDGLESAPLDGEQADETGTSDKDNKKKKGTRRNIFGKVVPERDRSRKENVWDSSLMLVGGGFLLLLVILFVALTWSLRGRSGDDMVKEADQYYMEQAYSKAIDQYEKFASQYPDHPKASWARARGPLALLRQVDEAGNDPVKSLEKANEVLDKITSEKAFPEVRDELSSLLPGIAEKLAKTAQKQNDPKLVEHARVALALVENDKIIPIKSRPKAQIDEIKAILGVTERTIMRDDQLAKAVAAMDKAVEAKDTSEAYKIRKTLLRDYPDLLDHEELDKAIRKVSAAEKAAVKWVAKEVPPTPPGDVPPEGIAIGLAQRTVAREVVGAEGRVAYAVAEGVAYGLDAASGRPLWRRAVGQQIDGTRIPFAPIPLDDSAGADALLVDTAAQSVVRILATTGKSRWLHGVGEPFDAEPALDGSRVLVATLSGRLVFIDIGTGKSDGFVQLPQGLNLPPTVDRKRSRIYQIAKHSNLFVLSADGKTCEKVVYLAQEPGSIASAPVILGNYLVVTENKSRDRSVLRIFTLDDQKKKPSLTQVQQIDIVGRLDLRPLVSSAQLMVTTDRGRVFAFALSTNEKGPPVEKVTDQQVSHRHDLIRFPLLIRGQFWIADDRLAKYELHTSMGQFRNVWMKCEDSAFLQPLVAMDDAIVTVRRRDRLPGVVVSAIDMRQGAARWETTLGAPLAAEPIVEKGSGVVQVVSSLGSVVEIPIDQIQGQKVIDEAAARVPTSQLETAVRDVLVLGNGRLAFSPGKDSTGAGSEQVYVYTPNAGAETLRNVVLRSPLGTTPVLLGNGLLAPSALGQVYLVDPWTGGTLAQPFQPKLAHGNQPKWQVPAVIDSQTVVLSDGARNLYRVGVKAKPEPNLALLDRGQPTEPIISPLAYVQDVVLAVDRTGKLQRFRLPKLTPEEPESLGGRPVWGPRAVGRHVFVTTDADQLFCLDAQGKIVWSTGLPHGPLAGPPLPVGNDFLLASCSGTVWRVEGASGKELGKHDTGRPLRTGPVSLGNQVLVAGQDGTLLRMDAP
ncbi:MAG: PQQ-binding-like beta-propeller repeat protein [Pirellulales bacterium]|nr:PQQ-binding-like beta-propeller repeat protein [Pirellulales bacterium]